MIGNKYGKVIILALINILAVCFVYNTVATDNSNIVLGQVEEGDIVKDTAEVVKHVDQTNISDRKSDRMAEHRQSIELDNNSEDTMDTFKQASDTNDSDTNSESQVSVSPVKEYSQDNFKHDAVMSMKNLLSIQIHALRVNRTTTVSSEPVQDEELNVQLLDSSEIDLSPPNPIIISSPINIGNQDSFHKLMDERSELLHKQCLGRENMAGVTSNWMYALKSKSLVWCPVYKAASTNWMHNLLHLAGKKEDEIKKIIADHPGQPNDQGRVVAPIISLSNIHNIASKDDARLLLIVRHPFDRLVSAFRDKLEQCHGPQNCTLSNNWYYKQYGKSIVTQYRKKAVKKFGNQYFSKGNKFGAPLPVNRTWRSESFPSWWEFVQYIIHTPTSSYDEHWKPASLYCAVCSFPYNHILHFENIQKEEKFFAEEMSSSDLIHPRWENRNDEGLAKEDILGKYFNLLDDQDIQALYKIYEDDFLNFGYQFKYKHFRFNVES